MIVGRCQLAVSKRQDALFQLAGEMLLYRIANLFADKVAN